MLNIHNNLIVAVYLLLLLALVPANVCVPVVSGTTFALFWFCWGFFFIQWCPQEEATLESQMHNILLKNVDCTGFSLCTSGK